MGSSGFPCHHLFCRLLRGKGDYWNYFVVSGSHHSTVKPSPVSTPVLFKWGDQHFLKCYTHKPLQHTKCSGHCLCSAFLAQPPLTRCSHTADITIVSSGRWWAAPFIPLLHSLGKMAHDQILNETIIVWSGLQGAIWAPGFREAPRISVAHLHSSQLRDLGLVKGDMVWTKPFKEREMRTDTVH